MKISVEDYRKCCEDLFTAIGVSQEDAQIVADAAITADLRGVASHGTVRLGVYRKRIEMGLINKNPEIKIENESETFLHINGDNGLGQVVAKKALDIAMERAKKYGCCAVSIHNTNHMGVLSYYSLIAAKNNMISNVMCNTPPFVAAIGGAEPIIGTNPICWGVPNEKFPVIMDMAISPARGKVKNILADGGLLPQGWALNKDGEPTVDPSEAMEGVLLPSGGVKGYGIGLIVEIFSAILSGSNFGKHITHPLDDFENKPDLGNFIMVFDIEKIIPTSVFMTRIQEYIEMVKSSKLSSGSSEIFIPGEIENAKEMKARKEGMEIDKELYDEYISLA